MSDWLDGWARRAARPEDRADAPSAARGLSRRQLLKRAGVVAGATWSAALIQSAVAPAASASGGPTPCTSGCADGTICSPAGTSTTLCASGYCGSNSLCATKSWTLGTCGTNSDCYSNVCTGGVCQKGTAGAVCNAQADCAFWAGGGQCMGGVCGGSGSICWYDGMCASGTCANWQCT